LISCSVNVLQERAKWARVGADDAFHARSAALDPAFDRPAASRTWQSAISPGTDANAALPQREREAGFDQCNHRRQGRTSSREAAGF